MACGWLEAGHDMDLCLVEVAESFFTINSCWGKVVSIWFCPFCLEFVLVRCWNTCPQGVNELVHENYFYIQNNMSFETCPFKVLQLWP